MIIDHFTHARTHTQREREREGGERGQAATATYLGVAGLDGVQGLEGGGGLQLEGVAGGDTERPLQTAHPQGALCVR